MHLRNNKLIKALEPVPGQPNEHWNSLSPSRHLFLWPHLVTSLAWGTARSTTSHSHITKQSLFPVLTVVSQETTTRLLSPLPPHRTELDHMVSFTGSVSSSLGQAPGQDNTSSLLSKANRLLRTILFSPVYRAQEVCTSPTGFRSIEQRKPFTSGKMLSL